MLRYNGYMNDGTYQRITKRSALKPRITITITGTTIKIAVVFPMWKKYILISYDIWLSTDCKMEWILPKIKKE